MGTAHEDRSGSLHRSLVGRDIRNGRMRLSHRGQARLRCVLGLGRHRQRPCPAATYRLRLCVCNHHTAPRARPGIVGMSRGRCRPRARGCCIALGYFAESSYVPSTRRRQYELRVAELAIGEVGLGGEIMARDMRIRELTEDRDASWAAVSRAYEQMHEWSDAIDSWRDAFDRNEDFLAKYDDLQDRYQALVKQWNKFVPDYNRIVAPRLRNFGRPLAAGPSQREDVLKRQTAGQSLRAIAGETGLGLRTVRTIIDKADGVDRASLARLKRIAPDKFAEARERIAKRTREAFPRRVAGMLKDAESLRKELKGIGGAL